MSDHEMTDVQRECKRLCGNKSLGWHDPNCPVIALAKNSAVAVPMSETKIPDDLKDLWDSSHETPSTARIGVDLLWQLIERIAAAEAREQELREENEQLSSKAEIWKNSANCFRLECESLRAEVERLKGLLDMEIRRTDSLHAQLVAMTEDRDLWRDEHNEDCPNEAQVEILKAQLAEIQKRYAFEENQALCEGYEGACDGDLESTEHEEGCPAKIKDMELRPHLYPPALRNQ